MSGHRVYVEHLPDLIQPEDYAGDPGGRQVHMCIEHGPQGIAILSDAMRAQELGRLLEVLDPLEIQQMHCGRAAHHFAPG